MSRKTLPLGLPRGTVRLAPADARWPGLFRAESERLAAAVASAGLPALAFEHVGSTAIPGLPAKPILDLMAGIGVSSSFGPYVERFLSLGYEARGPQGIPGRELFVLGPESARTHHLNLVELDGPFWRSHLAFRDRLRADPHLAAAYARLKAELAARHAADRAAYMAGKAAFVEAVLAGDPDAAQRRR